MGPDGVCGTSLESFVKAFEGILEGIADENGSRKKKFTSDDQKAISVIHKLISSSRTRKSSNSNRPPSSGVNIYELNESLLYEWEESAPPSVAVQQLVSLLSKPVVKSLLWTYEHIMDGRYSPQLPEIPYEVDDEEGIAIKMIRLVKGNEALGATIKCDTDGCVFVARIIAGGVADRCASIQVGDRVMEVNGVSVTGMKPTDIVKLLNTDDGTVQFKLIPAEMPTIVEYDEPRYVRALTDYDGSSDALHPCPEAALSFKRNEILELVVVNGDEHWWQARSIGFAPFDEYHSVDQSSDVKRRRIGIIPSELLHQKRRKQRESDSNSVRKGIKKNTAASRTLNEVYEGALYESVSLVSPNKKMIRSVVLIGASGVGRNELKRRLIMSNPERFSTTVPHTSRAPRAHEMQGVDYYFVKKDEMEHWIRLGRFLEFGEYRDNLYGTLADSVVSIIQQGRIPVLNPHPLALRLLRCSAFKPFVVFIKPPDFDTFKETRSQQRTRSLHVTQQQDARRGILTASNNAANSNTNTLSSSHSRGFTDPEIEQIIQSSDQLYHLYASYCDFVLINANLDVTFSQLSHIVKQLDYQPSWMPSAWLD